MEGRLNPMLAMLALLALVLTSCYASRRFPIGRTDPARPAPDRAYPVLGYVTIDSTSHDLDGTMRVVDDSLRFTVPPIAARGMLKERGGRTEIVPRDSVAYVRLQKISYPRTVLLAVGLAGGVLVVSVLAAASALAREESLM